MLRGQEFAVQAAALRPRENASTTGRASPQVASSEAQRKIATRTMSNVGRGPDMAVNDRPPLPGLAGGAMTMLGTAGEMARGGVVGLWEGAARGGAAMREHQGVGHVIGSAIEGVVDGRRMSREVGLGSSTEELGDVLTRETTGVAGGEGTAVARRFLANSNALRVLRGGVVSSEAAQHASLLASKGVIERELQNRMVASVAAHPDQPASAQLISDPPYLDFAQGSGVLQTVLGGTRGYEVWANGLRQDGSRYTFDATYKVFDNFGFDPSDCYSPGLLAGGLLQHYHGVQPFVHCVEVPMTLSGDLAAAPGEVHPEPEAPAAAAAAAAAGGDTAAGEIRGSSSP